MPLLRIKQSQINDNTFRADLRLEGDNVIPQEARAEFQFSVSEQDQSDVRWYLEDFLQYPEDPAPEVAKRVEGRLRALGCELFAAVFQSSEDNRDLWATLREHLPQLRVELVTGIQEATALPWELLRDLKTDSVLALTAAAFVRSYTSAATRPKLPNLDSGKLRILLVIARPREGDDVPFRSVSAELVKGLSEKAREHVEVVALRPPTFQRLGEVLRAAQREAKPFHIVHFDGHGAYAEADRPEFDHKAVSQNVMGAMWSWLRRCWPSSSKAKAAVPVVKLKRGFLLFEQPRLDDNCDLIDGSKLVQMLRETGVPVLILNACKSAYAEASNVPPTVENVHQEVRAFGSLAQEVMDCGVAGVVAMRYNVYVKTAAQFVADLYAALAEGQALGEAVSYGRKQLHAQPLREITRQPLPLQDWLVPVVYEATALRLFSPSATGLQFRLQAVARLRRRRSLRGGMWRRGRQWWW